MNTIKRSHFTLNNSLGTNTNSAPKFNDQSNNLGLNRNNQFTTQLLNLLSMIVQQLQGYNNTPTISKENVRLGNQNPANYSYNANKGTVSLKNATSSGHYSVAFMQEKFAEFERSGSKPQIETKDLRTTEWGYSGSSSKLKAFNNYMLEKYPGNYANNITSPAGNQNPVDYSYDANNNIVSLSNDKSSGRYSAAFLHEKLAEFRESDASPQIVSNNMAITEWGYADSGSLLIALYNYVLEEYPGNHANNITGRPGNQNPVDYSYDANNNIVSLSNDKSSGRYSAAFLHEKLAEFRESDASPQAVTNDMAITEWGYADSGSLLRALYNYMLEEYPGEHSITLS